ncbi:hypothetical protein BH11BAC5_BH11BAC5_53450 [soil metagenome]
MFSIQLRNKNYQLVYFKFLSKRQKKAVHAHHHPGGDKPGRCGQQAATFFETCSIPLRYPFDNSRTCLEQHPNKYRTNRPPNLVKSGLPARRKAGRGGLLHRHFLLHLLPPAIRVRYRPQWFYGAPLKK